MKTFDMNTMSLSRVNGIEIDAQLELGFGTPRSRSRGGRNSSRSPRAGWWFERMRQIVERASDWEPAPPARPEQTGFGGMYRQPAVLDEIRRASAEVQQVTE
jgi:hypothetical protein